MNKYPIQTFPSSLMAPKESGAHLLLLCMSSLKLPHFSSGQWKLHLQTSCSNRPCSSPDDNGHQPHDGFVEAVKELPQGPSLLLHAADHQTEAHGEHYQPQRVHPIGRARDGNDFFKGQHLGDGPQGMSDVLQEAGEVLRHRDLSGCHICCDIAAVGDGSGEDPGAVLRLVLKRQRLSDALTGPGSGAQDNMLGSCIPS